MKIKKKEAETGPLNKLSNRSNTCLFTGDISLTILAIFPHTNSVSIGRQVGRYTILTHYTKQVKVIGPHLLINDVIDPTITKLGCHHCSVDSSAPTILLPPVRVPSTLSMLLSLQSNLCYICHVKRTKITKKRPGLAHLKNITRTGRRGQNLPSATQV